MTEITAAVVGAVVGAVLAAILMRLQRKRRVLGWGMRTWQILSTTGLQDRVQLRFDDKPVNVVWSTLIFVNHVGNDAIPAEAFAEPIRLVTETPALLDVTLSGEAEGDGEVEIRAGEIIIAPRLFNPGDSLAISLVTDREVDSELYVRALNTKLDYLGLNMKTRAMPKFVRAVETMLVVVIVATIALIIAGDSVDDGRLGADSMFAVGLLAMALTFTTFLSKKSFRQRFIPRPWR